MKFRSNNCVAIHVKDLKKAERFYGDVLGFKLKSRARGYLCFNTGRFLLYINKSKKTQPPVPSFTVKSIREAKAHLKKAGCKIVHDWGGAIYFRDPFGIVYDAIEA
jgi:catechol 2,3-dioxygenase-like lactoylglutathione lyase family enzyme